MKTMNWTFSSRLLPVCSNIVLAQWDRAGGLVPVSCDATATVASQQHIDKGAARLDAQRETRALPILLKFEERFRHPGS